MKKHFYSKYHLLTLIITLCINFSTTLLATPSNLNSQLVDLGEGKAYLELIIDSDSSTAIIYFYQSDQNTPLYLEVNKIDVLIHRINEGDQTLNEGVEKVEFKAYVENFEKEENNTDTSLFEYQDERFANCTDVEFEIKSLKVGEIELKNFRFTM